MIICNIIVIPRRKPRFQKETHGRLMIYQLFPVLPLPIVVPREGKTGKIGCSSQEMIIHKSSWDSLDLLQKE